MKFIQATIWLFLGLICLPPLLSTAQAQVNPWPWEKELPFPWDNIEGVWGGVHDDMTMIFSFEIIINPSGHRQIKVLEIDPQTMTVVATGAGIENNNVLRAVIVGKKQKFRMSVRLVENEYCTNNTQYTVITIESMGKERFIFHFAVNKIANSPLTPPSTFNYNFDNFLIRPSVKQPCYY